MSFESGKRTTVANRAITWQMGIAVVGALVLSLMAPILHSNVAHAATCGSTHCYALAKWPNGILGAITHFETVHLYSVNNGQDHISEELWLVDDKHDCGGNGGSWVETGEATRVGSTGNWYFWADCRPGSTFIAHWQYQPPSGDVGQYSEYLIDKGSNPGTYSVASTSDATGNLHFTGTSASNTMSADWIQVGLETTNNSYSITHADTDYFRYNQYHGLNGVWAYQANPGNPPGGYSNNPPNWTWLTAPAPGGTGGLGRTTCC